MAISGSIKGDVLRGNASIPDLIRGEDGKSAYEIAVENGFKGTEEEWLESLKGANVYEVSSPEEIAADAPDGLYAVPNGGGGTTGGGAGGGGGTGGVCDTTELEQDIAELAERHQILEDDYMRSREQHSEQITQHTEQIGQVMSGLSVTIGDVDELEQRVAVLELSGGTGSGGTTGGENTELVQKVVKNTADIEALDQRVEGNEESIRDLYDKVQNSGGGTGGDTTELEQQIAEAKADIAELNQNVGKNAGDISNLQTTVSGHTTSINNIGASLTQTQRELDQLEMKVDSFNGVGNAFETLQSRVSEVERQVDQLDDFKGGIGESFDELQSRVSEVERQVDRLDDENGTIGESFDELKGQVMSNSIKIDAITGDVGNGFSYLDDMIKTVGDHTTTIDVHTTQLSIIEENVHYLLEKVSGIKDDRDLIDFLFDAVTVLQNTVAWHDARLAVAETDIENLEYRVADSEIGYRDSVRLTGANGKQYKLTIDANGSLVVTEVQYNHD